MHSELQKHLSGYQGSFWNSSDWPIGALKEEMKKLWKVNVSRCKLYMAKKRATTEILGIHKEQYAQL